MIPRDNVLPPSAASRSAMEADAPTKRATPQPTVLSTVWEGPPQDDQGDAIDGNRRTLDLDPSSVRSRLSGWLSAPTNHRRALGITIVVAVACGGVLAVFDLVERPPELPTATADESIDSTRGSLSSRAATTDAADEHADTADEDERVSPAQVPTDPDPSSREAVSADERIRLTATSVQTATGGWMLEAQLVDTTESAPAVRFTVNGAVVEEVEQAPYRLLLNDELLASSPSAVVERQPLIVTASALWSGGHEAASPATIVLAR